MILQRLTLNPFAAGRDRSIAFDRGLTVILGPNEAGKSTLAAALHRVLFAGGAMTQVRFRTLIAPYLPVGHGNTARVTLEFQSAGRAFRLERTWVAPKGLTSRLLLPDGGELADETKIQEVIEEYLGVHEGTYDNILSVSQASLSRTIERLAADAGNGTGGFADLLRKSLYASDGLAVDVFERNLNTRIAQHFGRWDQARNAPEKGRGIDDPWEKGAGTILNAYYEYQRAERAFREVDAFERKLDACAAKEKTIDERYAALSRIVASQSPIVDDARRRAELMRVFKDRETESRELREVIEQWPKAEAQLELTTGTIHALLARYAELESELAEAREHQRQQKIRELHAKSERLHSRLTEEEAAFKGLVPITSEQIEELRKEQSALQKIDIRISARKLALRLTAIAPAEIHLKAGSTDTPIHLKAGETYATTVSGKLDLTHPAMRLEVWPADDDAETLERQRTQVRARLAALLESVRATSTEEAFTSFKIYDAQRIKVETARKVLAEQLGDQTFDALSRQVSALRTTKPARTEEEIMQDLLVKRGEGEATRADQRAFQALCEKWSKAYGSRDSLLSKFATVKSEEQKVRETLERSAPLPEGYSDAGAFLAAYEISRAEMEEAYKVLVGVQKERLVLEKEAPAGTRREFEEILRTKKEEFERSLIRGQAYLRIRNELDRLLTVLDENLFAPYQRRTQELLGRLTLQRHAAVQMRGALPESIASDGHEVRLGQLSLGTLDVLAIAVRIAMAEVHLSDHDGFIILDDPLVNLDPERQNAAASCLQEFSRHHQIVVLTCHPSHADLLGGGRVVLT